jgi:hypothetical protein
MVSIEGPDGGVDITGATLLYFLVLLCLKKSLLFLT